MPLIRVGMVWICVAHEGRCLWVQVIVFVLSGAIAIAVKQQIRPWNACRVLINTTTQELRSFPDKLEPALSIGKQVNDMCRVK